MILYGPNRWEETATKNGTSIGLDTNGNVLVGGSFHETVDFDPGSGIFNLTAAGGSDAFLLKLNANGDFIWAKSFGGTGTDVLLGISVTESGNVLATGGFHDTADFDPGSGITNLIASSGGYDIFLQKLSSNGNFLWAHAMGTAPWNEVGNSIATDAYENVYTTGYYTDTIDFDLGPGVFNLPPVGISDAFIQKLDQNGNFIWARNMGSPTKSTKGQSIRIDANRNVYTVGTYNGPTDFDPGVGITVLTPVNTYDMFVQKLDSNGNFLWAKSFGGVGVDIVESCALDDLGNLYTTGRFANTTDFDPGTGVFNLTPTGLNDIFIQKLNSNGDFDWAVSLGGNNFEGGQYIEVNEEDQVHAVGYFVDTSDMDPGVNVHNLISGGSQNAFLVKLKPCSDPDLPTLSTNGNFLCSGTAVELHVALTDQLNGAANWSWRIDSCNGQEVGTGDTLMVAPTVTTTYYCRGEGDCISGGACSSITITVLDTTAPVPDVTNLLTINEQCGAVVTAPTATDNCVGTVTGTTTDPTTYSVQGTYTITWNYDDGNGNTINQSQTVTIADTFSPTFSGCPANIESCSPIVFWTAPVANDNCNVTVINSHNSGDSFPVGTTMVSYTATDDAGNTKTCSFNVLIRDSITVNPVITDALCFKDSTGTVQLNPSGGTGAISVNWGAVNPLALWAGYHKYTLTDFVGCTLVDSVLISEPDPLTSSSSSTDNLCFGDSTGTAQVNSSGGSGIITIDWGTANPLALWAGYHKYTLMDVQGCTLIDSVLISQPDLLILSATSSNEVQGNDGSIDLTIAGGKTPFTVTWDHGFTGEDPENLSAGTYIATVVDANGCNQVISVTVTGQVGFENSFLEQHTMLYPNPNSGLFTIEFQHVNIENLEIEVFSTLGRQVYYQKEPTNSKYLIDIRQAGAGIYFIKLNSKQGTVWKKIIIE